MPRKVLLALMVVCGAAFMLDACTSLPVQKPTAAPAQEAPPADAAAVRPLLEMMNSLSQGDPGPQAELFQSVKEAGEVTPTTSNRLRYALALATPGHGSSNAVAAQRQLSELLARPETLLPIERLLATVTLKEVEQTLILQAENKRMRDEAARDDRERQLQAANHRLASESDENARLRKALDEARAKLEAVTHVERSINDRSAGGSRTP